MTVLNPGGGGIPLTQKGAAGGVASLDSGTHIPAAQLSGAIGAAAGVFSPKDAVYGAIGDVIENNGSMTVGGNVLTMASAPFTSANVLAAYGGGYKYAVVTSAGANGGVLFSRITGYVSSTQVTLVDNAVATVANVTSAFGTDDTAALDAVGTAVQTAYSASYRSGTISVPPGGYIYQGTGLTLSYPRMASPASQIGTCFYMPQTSVLFASPLSGGNPAAIQGMHIENIDTFGGYGLIRLTYTGPQSGILDKVVDDSTCRSYAGTAISSLSSDDPYWKINAHMVNNQAGLFSVALAGQTDDCELDIDHIGCLYGIKLGLGGCSALVRGSWVGGVYAGSTPRVPVWVVPRNTYVNAGRQCIFDYFRWGNENQNSTDLRLLYADEDTTTGTDFSNNLPKWTASTGYIAGHKMTNCLMAGATGVGPAVYSTTPNVTGCQFEAIMDASLPQYFLQFLTPPAAGASNQGNRIRAILDEGDNSAVLANLLDASNGLGVAYLDDSDGMFSRFAENPLGWPGGTRATGAKLLVTASPTTVAGAATKASVADEQGGTDAYTVTFTNTTDAYYAAVTAGNVVVGMPLFIEFDLQAGPSSPVSDVQVTWNYSGGVIHKSRSFPVTAAWVQHRIMYVPRENTTTFHLTFYAGALSPSGGEANIGRVRVYQAREPINTDGRFLQNGALVTPGSPNYGGTFGDASDGAVVLDGTTSYAGFSSLAGSTYTLTRDIFSSSLTINTGVTLIPAGFRLFVAGPFAHAGTIGATGNAGTAAGVGGVGSGSGGIGGGRSGGAGNTGAGTAGGAGGLYAGGIAGAGSTGAAGAAGAKTIGSTYLFKTPAAMLTGVVNWSGVALAILGSGGGGGAGGPTIPIFAHSFVNTGTIAAGGGAGGSPTVGAAGGGGGGGGGFVVVYTLSAATMGTIQVTAGTFGTGFGTGTNGVAGTNGASMNVVLA